jgi:branched-chain amino acid transport system substrate-binding protein
MDDICRRGFKYTFRIVPEAARMMETLAEFAQSMGKKTGKKAETAVAMSVDMSYGRSYSKALHAAFKKLGIRSLADFYYPTKATDLTVEIANLKKKQPDVWFFNCQLNDSVLITRTLYQQNVEAHGFVACGAGFGDPQYMKMVGNLGNYFSINANFNPESELGIKFGKEIRTRYNMDSDPNSAVMYGCLYVIKDVLERAGSIDRDKVRDAIEKTHITSGPAMILSGKGVKFDENHENMLAKVDIMQSINGAWHVTWPPEAKPKFDVVWPRPSWKEIAKL